MSSNVASVKAGYAGDKEEKGNKYGICVDSELVDSSSYRVVGKYDAALNRRTQKSKQNEFYLMQVLERDESYYVWERFGQVGESHDSKLKPFSEKDAIKYFKREFCRKTGNKWESRKIFQQKQNKWFFLDFLGDDDVADSSSDSDNSSDSGSDNNSTFFEGLNLTMEQEKILAERLREMYPKPKRM